MDFYMPANNQQLSSADRAVWDSLHGALADEDGICFYNYPILGSTGQISAIDALFIHRTWGIYAFEIKPITIDRVVAVDEQTWVLTNSKMPNPYAMISNLLSTFMASVRQQIDLEGIRAYTFVAFPQISADEWDSERLGPLTRRANTLFREDLTPDALRARLTSIMPGESHGPLNDKEWSAIREFVVAQFMTVDEAIPDEPSGPPSPPPIEDLVDRFQRDVPSIFISYRRQDSAWAVRYIHDYLQEHFDRRIEIFLDVDTIGFGDRFDEVIDEEIKRSNVILVVIGNDWMRLALTNGMRRLDDPRDYVVREISTAIEYKKRIIPILLDGADMPRDIDLPEVITQLSLYHAFKLAPDTFHTQMPRLAKRLEGLLRTPQEMLSEARKDIEGILKGAKPRKPGK